MITNGHSMTISTEEWQKYNTLIVDDEPAIMESIARDLTLEGLNVFKATSAKEALAIIENEEVHVILSDQKMPGGMNGNDLLAQAYKKNPIIVGIILSAYSDADHLLNAINDAHVFRYLLKPWDKNKLIHCVKEALKFYRLRAQNPNGLEELGYTQHMFNDAIDKFSNAENSCRQLAMVINEAVHTLSAISDMSTQMANNIAILSKKVELSKEH